MDRVVNRWPESALSYNINMVEVLDLYAQVTIFIMPNTQNMAPSRIVRIARQILDHAENFDKYLQSNGIPTPSFEPDAPRYSGLAPSAMLDRQTVINLADELLDLMLGPSGPLMFPDVSVESLAAHVLPWLSSNAANLLR